MGSHRRTSRGRYSRRALTTAFCSLLVFAVGFGQGALPANAGAPSLTMGPVDTGNGGSGGSGDNTGTNVGGSRSPLVVPSLDSGDVSLDFIAAGHASYNHATGIG